MDDRRFDDLARGLASSSSRRQALKAIGAGVVGAAFSVVGVSSATAKEKDKDKKKPDCCPKDTPTLCGRTCVDLSDDPQHCGGCGNTCVPGGQCVNGVCVAPACDDSSDCPLPADPCLVAVCASGQCASAPRCPADATCDNGTCVCPSGTTYCESQNVCVPDCPIGLPLNPQTCQCDEHYCVSASEGCANLPCGQRPDTGQRCYCQFTVDDEPACIALPSSSQCDEIPPCGEGRPCDPGRVCIISDCCGPAEGLCLELCV
ncbi:MAG: hypothetical protein DCC58_02515 [Chloroflexi bacterium]|nr:MAG: hypothetical protein DCC58_02515 [Chloroflexota bacterium]